MSLLIRTLEIPDVKIITAKKHNDSRGFFSETYSKKAFAEAGITPDFVQDNHWMSPQVGTLRGLHYQGHPFAQDKLVRVVSGRIYDVAVDIRRASPTFGNWVAAEISSDEWNQILVPIGFAHAICTLEPNTQVIYKVSRYYAPQYEFGFCWNDRDLAITWPFPEDRLVLSNKDKNLPFFKNVVSVF
jgi:dTDP-4-dehydrorhamnose 3,5-epimerase